MPSLTSQTLASPQAIQQYGGSAQKTQSSRADHLNNPNTQHRSTHASQISDNWRTSGRPSFNSSRRSSPIVNSADTSPPLMTDVPEYLAVQEMAFRQGQSDSGNSRNKVPPSPFAKHFDHVWAQYFKMGAAYGGTPATPPVASSPSHDNFAWSVLINPITQDLEHLNGSIDIEWARKICVMSLNCMKELIHVVRERHNDWRKIVCDIPFPVKQAIVAFPDLCEYYEALQHDARQAFGNGL
jgi:transglutaminase/protease-like cytokinesis protein 3